ncbi:putative CRAL/TRIO domain-containing protein, partial [Operophtera brumata]
RVYLEKTLIGCKGSVEKAKTQIDKLCTLKTLLPKFFIGGDVKKNLGEMGGSNAKDDQRPLQDDWLEVLSSEEHEKHLAEMKASNTDESLRTPDQFNEQIMGLHGSFRTLTVD